jgi:hypothetical protein
VNLGELVAYTRAHGDGVVSTVDSDGTAQGAYVAIAVTDEGELVFNARRTSRKIENILRDAHAALTIGGRDGTTLQCHGVAEVLEGAQLSLCADAYYAAFPQFTRSSGDDIAFVRVRLGWARYGQYVGEVFESSEVDLTP